MDNDSNENETVYSKGKEYVKVLLFSFAVFLAGIFASMYSEVVSALLLFVGLTAALRMAVLVYKGGRAFD